jgi:hypothetical protein
VYRLHPNLERKYYILRDQFDSVIHTERRTELVNIVRDLGAKEHLISQDDAQETKKETEASLSAAGHGAGAGNKQNSANHAGATSSAKYAPATSSFEPKCDRKKTFWLQWEPEWEAMIAGGLGGRNTEFVVAVESQKSQVDCCRTYSCSVCQSIFSP